SVGERPPRVDQRPTRSDFPRPLRPPDQHHHPRHRGRARADRPLGDQPGQASPPWPAGRRACFDARTERTAVRRPPRRTLRPTRAAKPYEVAEREAEALDGARPIPADDTPPAALADDDPVLTRREVRVGASTAC